MTPDSMQLHAYLHKTKEGRAHLRVKQPRHTDNMKALLNRVGSPATWDQSVWEWDYPLTPAAILTLQAVADQTHSTVSWSDDLREYAEYYIRLEEYEENIRRSVEKAIVEKQALDPYPTNTVNGGMLPFHHQQISYHWALRTSGLLLAHEPGLGKTRSGADAAGGWYRHGIVQPMTQVWRPSSRAWNRAADKNSPPRGAWGVKGGVLIVAPKVMLRTWVEELSLWQNMTALSIDGSRKKKVERLGMPCHAHVANYEMLPLIIEVGNQYDAIIVDESHRCANHSNQTMNVLDLAMKARRRLLLTGTPVSNDLEAVFYQMLITDGGRALGASKTRFLEQYFNAQPTSNGQTEYQPREGALAQVSAKMSKCTYFLKKEEVLDLPEKTHTPLYLPMTDDQARYYEQLRKEAISYIQDSSITIELAVQRMMKLAQICQGFVVADDGEIRHFNDTKTQALTDMITNTYSGHKLVVWCRFTYEIERLCAQLQQLGIPYLRYDGKVNQRDRDRAKHLWQTDPTYRVFVGQLQMGIGVTLHAADCQVPCCNAAYLALDFSYVNWVQSMDRIHRIGQRWPCSYTYLLTENGIDRRIYQALQAKAQTADAVHKQGKDFYLSMLTEDTPRLAMID
jgi:SNF2 family DNA or RNA helicase